jgi:DNA-binding NtrC family response regulator
MSTFSYLPSTFQPLPMGKPLRDAIEPLRPHQAREWPMVGDSVAMLRLRLQIRRIGPHFRTVLIIGEPGAGKETAARALHSMSPGAEGPFLVSALGNRIDYLIKLAQRGTLYFDRINEMPLDTQDELLEILRRNEWAQDGLAAPQRMRPRIIASTNQELRTLTASGRFRQELYQRIAMVQIPLPTLRERAEDIPALATHFLGRFERNRRKNIMIANDAMEWLKSYTWPGNVRELEEMLKNSVLHADGRVLEIDDFLALTEDDEPGAQNSIGKGTAQTARLHDVVQQHILRTLESCAGNKLHAAELLGISRSTLYRMLSNRSDGMQLES